MGLPCAVELHNCVGWLQPFSILFFFVKKKKVFCGRLSGGHGGNHGLFQSLDLVPCGALDDQELLPYTLRRSQKTPSLPHHLYKGRACGRYQPSSPANIKMGIPRLRQLLEPYAERNDLGDRRVVIDGPGLAYHIFNQCQTKAPSGSLFDQPSYAVLGRAAINWLDHLTGSGAVL